MERFEYLLNAHGAAIEDLYQTYLRDPDSVDASWKQFFDGFEFSRQTANGAAVAVAPAAVPPVSGAAEKEINVLNLINGYRLRGHLFTKTNPVRERRKYRPTLDIENFGLNAADLDTVFQAGTDIGIGPAPLRTIVDHLRTTYCQSIGAEFRYMLDPETVEWLQTKMESTKNTPHFSATEKKQILSDLNEAVGFEKFLHTKFVGQKRFSLEGGETLIPALEAVIERGSELGIKEFVVGMAHRGRLNLLTNIFGKRYEDVFAEFKSTGYGEKVEGFEGDVKYHLGYSSDRVLPNGNKVHLSLTPNPSHLEAVDPVVQGIVRSKLDDTYGGDENCIAPILIHGDAAVAAQGIVYEVIQMSGLSGYKTGGTIHLVVNNQVGFTTNYLDARTSTYCTDVAKVTRSPVFHVNGDDVEAVLLAVQMAVEFRQRYHRDVFIDLLCYRKHGHNEGDEPRFTQPLLYKAIAKHPNPRDIYHKKLVDQGVVTDDEVAAMEKAFHDALEEQLKAAEARPYAKLFSYLEGKWKGMQVPAENDFATSPQTGVAEKTLRPLAEKMITIPHDVNCFRKVLKVFDDRKKMLNETDQLDWAMGEWLAYASLLSEGTPVRISGQDVERGTFAHRHAVLTVENKEVEAEYVPLNHLTPQQAKFEIVNSLLSEYGVLGFEFGYALADPRPLVIWEAQFGDFANGAQIMIDQFVSCSATKWQRMNGLVMLLPHGYEGQGPEHSSARVERFLELCAGNNMQVVNCTTPANLFHALRRQIHRPFRLPLIVMTPKSLLRHPRCVSSFNDFTTGCFQELIDDTSVDAQKVTRVVFASGKVYYDLLAKREDEKLDSVAIVRLEQLYPLPEAQLEAVIKKYSKVKEWIWAQEEPLNMGAWPFICRKVKQVALEVVARKEASSPASGFHTQHLSQQEYVIKMALGIWS